MVVPFNSKPKRRLAPIKSPAKSQAMIATARSVAALSAYSDPIGRGPSRVAHRPHFECNKTRRAAPRLLPISSVYYSLARMGEMYVFERPHPSFWFGCGIRATPLGSTFDGEKQ